MDYQLNSVCNCILTELNKLYQLNHGGKGVESFFNEFERKNKALMDAIYNQLLQDEFVSSSAGYGDDKYRLTITRKGIDGS
jgi:hypothetical protein